MKGIKSIIALTIIFFRIYCVFKVGQGLYFNYFEKYPLENIQWYVYFLFLDLYVIKIIQDSISFDIYTKKEDESKTNQ